MDLGDVSTLYVPMNGVAMDQHAFVNTLLVRTSFDDVLGTTVTLSSAMIALRMLSNASHCGLNAS